MLSYLDSRAAQSVVLLSYCSPMPARANPNVYRNDEPYYGKMRVNCRNCGASPINLGERDPCSYCASTPTYSILEGAKNG
jgi:hypothetical protein